MVVLPGGETRVRKARASEELEFTELDAEPILPIETVEVAGDEPHLEVLKNPR